MEALANTPLSPRAHRSLRWNWNSLGARAFDQNPCNSLDFARDWLVAR
jgi:hypothetical protein